MSAVYDPSSFTALWNEALEAVQTYVQQTPGKSLDEIAIACDVPYEVVWMCCQALGYVIVPSASGEIHWHAHRL